MYRCVYELAQVLARERRRMRMRDLFAATPTAN